ncbi:MAG: hypothetical protein DCF15_08770 [Phormidesmis priestleyi]|uniref:Uncharacterized protein n=1 Tax=Phormidesmis priestleyi TaxID=268141 RepID=A0A2W4XGI5_9CYAN|nr:MAG: hypothetical protein DCF15_08770 [Phormidesmis priestleyi]
MIGGIFETIGRTLGVGKEKFFLELDEAAETAESIAKSTVEKVKAPAAKAVEAVKEVSGDVAEKAKDAAAKAEDAIEKATAKNAAKTPDKKEAKKKAAKKTTAKKGASQNGAAPVAAEPAPVAALPPAPPTPEELIVNAIAAGSKKTDAQGNLVEEVQTFSTDHLMPLGNRSRRRPGPSFGAFKSMAKEVNPRLKN